MSETRVKIQSIVENQLPDFIADESPLLVEFLKQYYISQEFPSGTADIVQNIDKYIKLQELLSSASTAIVSATISYTDTTINVSTTTDKEGNILPGTYGFPDRYGLIKINDEIITYTHKTTNTFEGCTRGFSGVTSYSKVNNPEELIFSTSAAAEHEIESYEGAAVGPIVYNLSGLFLDQFLTKLKKQISPGFDDRSLATGLNQDVFLKQSKDFYSSKGTDKSFEILFGALYGEKVKVVKPRDFLFKPSDAGWRRTKDIVVQRISGNPIELLNNTLYQDEKSDYDIGEAYASITDVEKIAIGGTEYYKLSFDADYSKDLALEGTIYGTFSVHPQTKLITPVAVGATILDVDSTVGFAKSGELVVDYNGTTGVATYTHKSITQFFGVSNVTSGIGTNTDVRLNVDAYGYGGIGTTNPIKVRIGSVLDEVVLPEKTRLFSKNDTARIKTLGISSSTIRREGWINNIPNTYKISSFTLIDAGNWTYNVTTYDTHNFIAGDTAQVEEANTVKTNTQIIAILSATSFTMRGQGELDPSTTYEIRKDLLKVDSTRYAYLNNVNANIQNTYTNFKDQVLVGSPSLPYYYDSLINPYDRKVKIQGSYSGTEIDLLANEPTLDDHGFFTGDRIYYSPYILDIGNEDIGFSTALSKLEGLQEGLYYVNRINSQKVNLANSPADIANSDFISVSGFATNNSIQQFDFNSKNLQAQNILKQIDHPLNKSGNYVTEPGKTGILINGVEILNFKATETVFYGSIDHIEVAAGGEDYDVINPPSLDITDSTGVGATGICAINGSLERIDIIDPGFDYIGTPFITVSGGDGSGAGAEVNMRSIDHSIAFDATNKGSTGNIYVGYGQTASIGFSTYHKFRDAERVIYKPNGQTGLAGLTTDSFYYAGVINATTIRLHKTEDDAVAGINTVYITAYGKGEQEFRSAQKKNIISDIVVTAGGEGYKNRETTVSSSGVSTALNRINIQDHGYTTGETLTYSTTGTVIEGLNTSDQYVVKTVNDDSFKLAPVGLGTTSKNEYLDSGQFVELRSVGTGIHSFNYPAISVVVSGNVGVSTLSGQNFDAIVQPVFRGSVESVHLTDKGRQYGSDSIMNWNRQPVFEFRSGTGAEAFVIVTQGRIAEVLVTRGGSGYNSPPNITIEGEGNYAKLTPVIENGEIKEIKVIHGGAGYTDGTTLIIDPAGERGRLRANIQKWTINLFKKYFDTITDDDGIVTRSDRESQGLGLCALYPPRKLREMINVKNADGQIQYGVGDLRKANNIEQASQYHSPILGWAYDGNPIYGPYGYTTPTGGSVRPMESGYESISRTNRPSLSSFPQGFFNEDFIFKGTGDLDRHNGRFCVTPDYPDGVYAYFSTLKPGTPDADGPFKNYFRPEYPYFIGTSFYSVPTAFNFRKTANQDDYNLNESGWFRNTLDYEIKGANSRYDFIYHPDLDKNQTVDIKAATSGGVTSIGIVTGGSNYNVNDRVLFDNSLTEGRNAAAAVKKIYGANVDALSVATTSFSNVEFATLDGKGKVIGFTTSPHGLKEGETLNLSGFNTSFAHIEGNYNIGLRTDNFITTLGFGTTGATGLTTFFYTTGFLGFPYIRENDILSVGSASTAESVRVLNVDSIGKRIRVLRAVDGTVGTANSAGTILYENPRKFRINSGFKTDYSYSTNREIYFNPNESIGIGTSAIAGIGSTVVFSMPGLGATQAFVPYSQIYIPRHGLKTGEKVTYSNHGGTGIGCWHPITGITSGTTFELPEGQDLYIANFGRDFIGISTVKVGLGTTGVFVGVGSTTTQQLPFFQNFGIGDYHSFTTKRTAITGEIDQNIVTVSTASSHGLKLSDTIDFVVVPTNTGVVTVKYDDDNRRIVFKPRTIESVDTSADTITIENHEFVTGDKVILTGTDLADAGLVDEKIYYVLYYTKDKIRLCETKYDLYLNIPNYVQITGSTTATVSLINPPLNAYKNKIIKFDVSDASLNSTIGFTSYTAFALNFYRDREYKYKFEGTGTTQNFEVTRSGQVGISSDASVSLIVNKEFPENLYYKLDVVNEDLIEDIKKEVIIDNEVPNYTQISLVDSKYSGSHRVLGIASTSFQFTISDYPEASSYSRVDANVYYTTKSLTAYGAIESIDILNAGSNYKYVPGITTISTLHGKGALIDVTSNTIGQILSTEVEDIGFNYPTDFTLNPSLNLPEVLLIKPLTSFGRIGISSQGRNYIVPPQLVVLDGYTGEKVNDVVLKYDLGDIEVNIVDNTSGMYNVPPTIIPIHNSNGVGINTIVYSTSSPGIVTAGINTGFSDIFPVAVGDKILVESTSVGIGSTAKGYNSDMYNYALFPVIAVKENLGGEKGEITYDMSAVLADGEYPGFFDDTSSYGRIIPEKFFPGFDIQLKVNDFNINEEVVGISGNGIVENWNNKVWILKVSSDSDLLVGDTLSGQSSGTKGVIADKVEFDSYVKLGPTASVNKGWIYDTGVLNNNVQRLHDNDYYQYFSYALESTVPYTTWNEAVSSLDHTAGFLKFSDLLLESTESASAKIYATDSDTEIIADLIGSGNLNCVYSFDLATEVGAVVGSTLLSNEIVFESRILTDYDEAVANRVLIIDDFSDTFNHKPRSTRYSVATEFELVDARTKKYFTYVRDKRYTQERQVLVVSLLHDGVNGYLNQYGRVETHPDLGSFDFKIQGSKGQLTFYPIKYKANNYDITFVSHDLKSTVSGVGSTSLGDIVQVNSHQAEIADGSSSAVTIVGIASTYRSAKVLVEIGSNNYYEYDELNLIHDGSTVDFEEYGQLTDNNLSSFGVGGLGTYYPYIDGSRLKIDFYPNAAVSGVHTVNSLSVSIASSVSTATGVGTAKELTAGLLDSWYTSIAASGTPGINTIAEYHDDSHAAYYIVQLEDTTNKRYEMAEVIMCDDDDYNALTEFGNIRMHTTGLGTISAELNSANRGVLTFIPNHNIKVQVRVFQNVLSLVKTGVPDTEIDLGNAFFRSYYGEYRGTETDIKRGFGLTHNNLPIFQRFVDGSDSSIVSISANTVTVPDHYFVTGEKLKYSWAGAGSSQAIGIGTSVIAGIGTTDKLPETVYAVKVDEKTLKFASSPTLALLTAPEVLDITSVGIGTSHSFTATNQNSKALIAIDNWFQSPIVGSAITTTVAKNVALLDEKITFSGITSFFSGDIVQINNELMKINTIGIGSTNIILVDRPWMGTGLSTHASGDLIQKIEGDYTIRENRIHFVEAPYGKDPISTTSAQPDDQSWTGVSTHSTFHGRTFMRSGKENTDAETYANNIVFDDISNQFTGLAKTFTLTKDGGSNASGFSTSNAIILINGIFQGPEGPQGRVEDYDLSESAGVSSITFTGTASSVTYDINSSNVPVGGIIVSVGSTEGFGLQPLVAAGGTAVVSSAGTVSSVGMGTSGSGYRLDLQPTVNVAIKTSSLGTPNIVAIGTAQIVNGGITGIAITNPHVFYAPVDISNVEYSGTTGLATVTTVTDHGLQRGEEVVLSGIAMTCEYAAPVSISTAEYTSASGIMTVTTSTAHGLNATGKSSLVIFTGLAFTCGIDSGISTHFYPRGNDYAYANPVSIASSTTNTITVNVGVAGPGDQYAHTFKRASTNAIVSGGDYLHSFVSGVTSCVISGGNYLHTFDSVGVTSITVTGIGSITPTNATYNPITGDMVLTVGSGHTYTTSNTVSFGTSSLNFTCALDSDSTTHAYPRATDPVAGINTSITAITGSTITVNVGTSRSVFFDVVDAQYTGSTGIMTLNIGSHGLTTGTSIRLMNEGLSFRCAMDDNKTIHKYPRSTDPYYDTAISIAATTSTTISLNVGITSLVYNDVSAATYDPSSGDLVLTVGSGHSLNTGTKIKIAESSLTFTCARDAHATEHSYPRRPDPTYAGLPVVGIASTTTFSVNVGTSTVPTFYQGGGKVQAAIIVPRANNFSSSKQDPASDGTPIDRILNDTSFTVNVGVSTREHLYARGGKIDKKLDVIFDDPLAYSNIPLIYSSENSTTGMGTWATADIVVGQGSSVVEFSVRNTGYGFGQGETLTVDVGGSAGIPTDPTLTYKEFQLSIEEVRAAAFAGWTIGDLQVIDNWDSLIDGERKNFPIKYNDQYLTIRSAEGSNIDVQATLLIFVNDLLQKPGESYEFPGGSTVKFVEPLKKGDTTKILYYKGTEDVDVTFKDVLETVKEGDGLTLNFDAKLGQGYGLQQDKRICIGINTTDSVQTNPYAGPGITTNDTLTRPVTWCKQTRDLIINGKRVGKDRVQYEPLVQPMSYLIQNVGVASTCAWVQNAKPFFAPADENWVAKYTGIVDLISQDNKVGASATANVSTAGTITSISITSGGFGYSSTPTVTIGSPVGLGTTPGDNQAYASATLSSGVVSAITIGSTPGSGYTSTNPPEVLIGEPVLVKGQAKSVTYEGDFGIISGIKTTSVGVASTGIVFDLFIPPDSELRDSEIVGVTTVSGIGTGYYFTVSNSTVGNGVTSLDAGSATVGIGSTFIDNVYQVAAVSIGVTAAENKTGAGLTAVAHVTVSVESWNGLSGLGYSSFYGEFSWGKILFGETRSDAKAYNAYTTDGVTGIPTGGIVRRYNPLRWNNYSS